MFNVIKDVCIVHRGVWWAIRLSHDGIALSCWSLRFDCNTASLHQAMRSIVYVSLFVACWFAATGAFRSPLLFRLLDVVPSQVRFVVDRLFCFLIVGIQASGISIPPSLLMLLGWSLIWIASLTLRVYQSKSKSYTVQISHMGYMCTGNGQQLVSHSNGFYWLNR